MQYMFTDVQFRGAYPKFAQNYFADHDIKLAITDAEMKDQREPNDFLRISYYYSQMVDSTKNKYEVNRYYT